MSSHSIPSPQPSTLKHDYKPLDKEKREIRLLYLERIIPSTDSCKERIAGRLEHVSLEDSPTFQSLSYHWGQPNYTSDVVLEDGSTIAIGENLLTALLHVFANGFAPGGPGLWVDAICINQEDVPEKSWQVQQMGDIYSYSSKTLVFLGPGDETSDEAMGMFERTGQEAIDYNCLDVLDDDKAARVAQNYALKENNEYAASSIEELLTRIIEDEFGKNYMPTYLVRGILDRPWFRRIWVLQELVLSHSATFICGHRTIAAEKLVAALFLFEYIGVTCWRISEFRFESHDPKILGLASYVGEFPFDYHVLPAMQSYLRRSWSDDGSFLPFSHLRIILRLVCFSTHKMQVTDPRDMIYALLGLVSSENENGRIKPDYSLSCREVYVQGTLHLLQDGCSHLLGLAMGPKQQIGLPSWVVDWSATSNNYKTGFSATSEMEYVYERRDDIHHVLKVRGTEFGRIEVLPTKAIPPTGQEGESEINHTARYPWEEEGDSERADRISSELKALGHLLTKDTQDKSQAQLRYNMLAIAIVSLGAMPLEPDSEREELDKFAVTPSSVIKWRQDFPFINSWNRASVIANMLAGEPVFDFNASYAAHMHVENAVAEHWPEKTGLDNTGRDNFLRLPDDDPKLTGLKADLLFISEDRVRRYTSFLMACSDVDKMKRTHMPFISSDGKFTGLCEKNVRTGDVLARFRGDPTAFVVRDVEEGALCELVGDARVPQLGPYLVEEEGDGEEKWFCLC